MPRHIQIIAVLICIGCLGYLVISPMDRTRYFLTRYFGKVLFPRLDPYRQQQRTAFFAGMVLAVILSAEIITFVIKHFNH